ncbi:hypothetical protein [Streptomyces sp. NPDC059979]|uniref:hypothetical protein n=1 Tax=unclassified Streptomyces TaxID=2593676 RepID=UPI003661348B
MRTRLLGFTAAVILAVLGALAPVAQAAAPDVDRAKCEAHYGKVQYDSGTGLWICVGGPYDGESVP